MDNGRKPRRNFVSHQEASSSPSYQTPVSTTGSRQPLAYQAVAITPHGRGSQDHNYAYGETSPYYSPPSAGGTFPYQVDFSQEQAQRANIQQYMQYGTNAMYAMPAQPSPYAQYSSVQPYDQRQAAAIGGMQTLSGVAPPFFVQGELGPTRVQPNPISPAVVQSSQNLYPQRQQQQPQSTQYLGDAAYTSVRTQTTPQVAMASSTTSHEATIRQTDTWQSYTSELHRTFQNIQNGHLEEAALILLDLFTWLSRNVEVLNLALDGDVSLRPVRLKLWTDFNHAWLALLLKQKVICQEQLQPTKPESTTPVTRMPRDLLDRLGNELVDHCDKHLEKWGLVDYEIGVWEEQIIHLLIECRQLAAQLDDQPGVPSDPPTCAGPPVPPIPSSSSSSKRKR